MSERPDEIDQLFARHNASLPQEVRGELQSICRLHSLSLQELFFKWESYSIKMGSEETNMDLKTARDFKKDLQEVLERESRVKLQNRGSETKRLGATPRNAKNSMDIFGMIEDVVPDTPRVPMSGVNGNSIKRKNTYATPASKATKSHANSSPGDARTPLSTTKDGESTVSFAERQNAGQIVETINDHIQMGEAPPVPYATSRINLKANTDLGKFSYKSMAMKLSEASEILDERIDEFLSMVQTFHKLDDGAFGNPATQGTSEIVAVGRIASDSNEGKLNPASIVLETSRRTGAGLRVPLMLNGLSGFELFPGKIVAVRGSNASGQYFTVNEFLELPLLAPAITSVAELDAVRVKMAGDLDTLAPLNMLISSGPYTSDFNLDYEPLDALCEKAKSSCTDIMILTGPFLDVEHPMVASGMIPKLPPSLNINPDTATLTDVFCGLVSLPLQRLVQAVPSITIILVPSVRDAVNKHVSWPQDRMIRKELRLPKQVSIVTNPITLTINDFMIAISSQDILYELRQEECTSGSLPNGNNGLLARLSRHLIEQRHFFPLFPPTARENLPKRSEIVRSDNKADPSDRKAIGAMLDISYLALGEWQLAKPDIMILPSVLPPFAKVVESVLVCNPGTLSKRRGPGTFAQFTVQPREITEEEREQNEDGAQKLENKVFGRTRVDVIRI